MEPWQEIDDAVSSDWSPEKWERRANEILERTTWPPAGASILEVVEERDWSVRLRDFLYMGSTARAQIGKSAGAVLPRWVKKTFDTDKTILDFGCGVDAVHVKALRKAGFKAVGYEWPPSEEMDDARSEKYRQAVKAGLIDPRALSKEYDVVMASNVLNVQPSWDAFHLSLRQIKKAVKAGGRFVANLPTSPRILWSKKVAGFKKLFNLMSQHWGEIDDEKGQASPIVVCSDPKATGYEAELAILKKVKGG